ncbi:phage tail tape measure protein [Chromohalobacter israelensis]|uniref:Phage tail tape measure protein TP901, core region n=1 Tax=Chromohalobacter israelensis (strain ATCC BAA-138 / DSM 3043 / CIP 106854 / NCIMB 13768 / 1H11) TaxID=290398 RepID=Q1QXS8_CHRI1|nr:phage tail tape measure protein [Chromohalobacter salexigens]ABE58730.1 Phage tail tape measure protein TP901, core region [Chromohalobacter salexigens DSM 3043]
MARDLKLQVILDAADKATAPLKKITRGSSKTADALRASKEELRKLERQQRDLGSFRKLKEATRENGEALAAAQERLRNMRGELKRTDAPTEKFQRQFKQASDEVERLSGKLGDQRRRLGELRTGLHQGGVSTDNLGRSEDQLAERIREANTQFDAQKRKMGQLAEAQRKAKRANDQFHRGIGRANGMRGAGMTGLATGGAALYGASRLLSPGVEYGQQMSAVQAVGRFNADDERFKALKQQSRDLGSSTQFSAGEVGSGQEFLLRAGMSAKAIQSSMKDVLSLAVANNTELGRTADIASNIAGTFKIDLEKEGAMGHVADVLSATASRANVDLAKLGETVKYLGGAEDLDFTLEQASAMAGLLGNIGIQGSQAGTTLRGMMNRLTDPTKEAAGVIDRLGVKVANADGEMRAMPEILRDINDATKDLGNADRKQALQQIFGAEAGSGMAELVSQMSTGKLDGLIEKLRVANGENDRMAATMKDNIGGDLKSLQSAWEEVGISITDTNKGPLRELIQNVTAITRWVGDWIKQNPELAGGIAKAAAGLAVLVAVGGAFTIMLASLLGPIVTVRYGLAMLGIQTGGLGGRIYAFTSKILPALGRGILMVGRTLTLAGRLLLTNPIGLAITALAGAAYLIYKNWEPISQFFKDRWADVKAAFSQGTGAVLQLLLNWNPIGLLYRGITAGLSKLGVEVPGKFTSLGSAIVDGLIGGLTGKLAALKDKVVGMASDVKGWFADVLDINSPSRVFAQLGGHTVDGLNVGLDAQRDEPARRVAEIAKRVQQAGAGLALGAATLPATAMPTVAQQAPIQFDTRPPLSQSAPRESGGLTMGDINIEVNAAPGMDERQLAQYVAQEVQRALADQQDQLNARRRSSLRDTE